MTIDLTNINVLVTGASNGIGNAISRQLLESGANVALHYNTDYKSAQKLAQEFPNQAVCFHGNLLHEIHCQDLFEEMIGHFGKLDVIINNAGVFKSHPIDESFENWWEVWQQTMNINLNSAAILTKLGLSHFMEFGGGKIIYIASRAAFRGETEEYLAYAASKGGMVSLAKSVARSFGKYNITSFVIAPGYTRTDMSESYIRENGEEGILKEISLNELTKPQDIAPVITLICSGKMNHATGTTIDFNAGSYMH